MYSFYQIEGEEKEKLATEVVKTVEKEIEPLLEGAAPFFGGSETLTLAEVGASIHRYSAYGTRFDSRTGVDGLIRRSLPGFSRTWSDAGEYTQGTGRFAELQSLEQGDS